MEISSGKIAMPLKTILYGPEGIGKSTFAAKWPKPLFVDVEHGSYQLDVDRVTPKSYAELMAIVAELTRDVKGYQTIVFDTADWMEKMLCEQICMADKRPSIESWEWGKGWLKVAELWKRTLDQIDALRKAQSVNILFTAHSCIRHVDPPDASGYDRYELKLYKNSNGILKEWADMILFANYEIFKVESKSGKDKATGGQRVMFAEHDPAFDAKNRFGLPARMKFDYAEIAKIVFRRGTVMQETPPAPVKPAAEPEPPKETPPQEPLEQHRYTREDCSPDLPPLVKAESPDKTKLIEQLQSLCASSGVTLHELKLEVARKGMYPVETKPSQYAADKLAKIIANWEIIKKNIINARG